MGGEILSLAPFGSVDILKSDLAHAEQLAIDMDDLQFPAFVGAFNHSRRPALAVYPGGRDIAVSAAARPARSAFRTRPKLMIAALSPDSLSRICSLAPVRAARLTQVKPNFPMASA